MHIITGNAYYIGSSAQVLKCSSAQVLARLRLAVRAIVLGLRLLFARHLGRRRTPSIVLSVYWCNGGHVAQDPLQAAYPCCQDSAVLEVQGEDATLEGRLAAAGSEAGGVEGGSAAARQCVARGPARVFARRVPHLGGL